MNSWIGVADGACATLRGALPLRAAEVRSMRPDGGRVAAAAPAGSVFFERIAFQNVSWKEARRLVPGKLDLALPLPIERCAVMAIPAAGSRDPLFMAFAMPRDACARRVDDVAEECGCRPEALVPAAAALWCAAASSGTGDAMLLHVSGASATLVAVEGGAIAGVATAKVSDEPMIVRDATLLSGRLASPCRRMVVSGPGASPELAVRIGDALAASGIRVEVAADHETFLARGIAALASRTCRDGGFLGGGLAHPATARRRRRSAAAMSVAAAALAICALLASAWRLRSAMVERDRREAALCAMASEVAGKPLSQKGRAAAELAKSLSDWANPDIKALTDWHTIDVLPAMLDAAAGRGATFSSIRYEGDVLTLRGVARDTADVAEMRRVAEAASYAAHADTTKSQDGIGFEMRVFARDKGVGP